MVIVDLFRRIRCEPNHWNKSTNHQSPTIQRSEIQNPQGPAVAIKDSTHMEMVNRLAIILTPRRRFVEWINKVSGVAKQLHYDDRSSERAVYLVAGPDEADLQEIIE